MKSIWTPRESRWDGASWGLNQGCCPEPLTRPFLAPREHPSMTPGVPAPLGCSAGTSRFEAKLIQVTAVSPGSQPSGLAEPSPGTTPPPHRSTWESGCRTVVPSCRDWQIGGQPQAPEVGARVRNGTPLPLPRGGQGLPSTPLPAQCQSSQYQCPGKAWEPARWAAPASRGEGCCLCPGTLLSRLACGDPARSVTLRPAALLREGPGAPPLSQVPSDLGRVRSAWGGQRGRSPGPQSVLVSLFYKWLTNFPSTTC